MSDNQEWFDALDAPKYIEGNKVEIHFNYLVSVAAGKVNPFGNANDFITGSSIIVNAETLEQSLIEARSQYEFLTM